MIGLIDQSFSFVLRLSENTKQFVWRDTEKEKRVDIWHSFEYSIPFNSVSFRSVSFIGRISSRLISFHLVLCMCPREREREIV